MNNFIPWIMLVTFGALTLVMPSYASREADWQIIPEDTTRAIYRKISIPKELTYAQLQQLKNGSLQVGYLELTNSDGVFAKKMPSSVRVFSNALFKGYKAVLTESFTRDADHLSKCVLTYEVPNWEGFVFTVSGVDHALEDAVEVRDINEEARELVTTMTPLQLGYNSPSATHIRLDPEILQVLAQVRLLESFEFINPAAELSDPNATRKMILNGAKYVISTALAPVVQKYVPGAKYAYEYGLLVCKTAGIPTFTHLASRVFEKDELQIPLLKTSTDKMAHEGAFAISQGLGCVIKYIPFSRILRNIGTEAVRMKGYPTITHFLLGYRDMSAEEIMQIRTPIHMAELSVAATVESFVPGGAIIVAVSQNSAKLFFDETSMTAFVLKKITKKKNSE